MADVMEMGMDPTPMGIDLNILSAEAHRDLRMLENRPRGLARQETSQESSSSERTRRQRRAYSDDSIDTPPDRSTAKKQRGRPRLDPTDENAADVNPLSYPRAASPHANGYSAGGHRSDWHSVPTG